MWNSGRKYNFFQKLIGADKRGEKKAEEADMQEWADYLSEKININPPLSADQVRSWAAANGIESSKELEGVIEPYLRNVSASATGIDFKQNPWIMKLDARHLPVEMIGEAKKETDAFRSSLIHGTRADNTGIETFHQKAKQFLQEKADTIVINHLKKVKDDFYKAIDIAVIAVKDFEKEAVKGNYPIIAGSNMIPFINTPREGRG